MESGHGLFFVGGERDIRTVKKFAWLTIALLTAGCGLRPIPPAPPQPPTSPSRTVAIVVADTTGHAVAGATVTLDDTVPPGPHVGLTNTPDGYLAFATVNRTLGPAAVHVRAAGCADYDVPVTLSTGAAADNQTIQIGTVRSALGNAPDIALPAMVCTPPLPPAPTREYIIGAHESFQGAVLHTSQFGDLNWWPTAWVSLNPFDTTASYPQISAWGDTDITVSVSWSYGEAGQPYGDGQLVPNQDYTNNWPAFRARVLDVIHHTAANGHPFVPRIFLEGDNGYAYYMWVMPLALKALQPQSDDPVDLTPYVKLQMCYDSCVPGWQPKTQVGDAILATRAACPACIIALEFSSGYSSTGDGDEFWNSDAGRALDEVDWEGNYWPPTDWEQYWEILDRWLGPAYIKPAAQQSDPDAPFCATCAKFYLRNGTPRGPYGVQCLEPFTYQWVRGQITMAQSNAAFQTLTSLGCPVIDMPTVRP